MHLLYSTIDNITAAKNIAHTVLQAKLAACVNILPKGTSLYLTGGKIKETREYYMLFKTTKDKAAELKDQILSTHPYEVPCVIELAASMANSTFELWLTEELTK